MQIVILLHNWTRIFPEDFNDDRLPWTRPPWARDLMQHVLEKRDKYDRFSLVKEDDWYPIPLNLLQSTAVRDSKGNYHLGTQAKAVVAQIFSETSVFRDALNRAAESSSSASSSAPSASSISPSAPAPALQHQAAKCLWWQNAI